MEACRLRWKTSFRISALSAFPHLVGRGSGGVRKCGSTAEGQIERKIEALIKNNSCNIKSIKNDVTRIFLNQKLIKNYDTFAILEETSVLKASALLEFCLNFR